MTHFVFNVQNRNWIISGIPTPNYLLPVDLETMNIIHLCLILDKTDFD